MEYIEYWSAILPGLGILCARLVASRRAARVPATVPATALVRLAAHGGRSPRGRG